MCRISDYKEMSHQSTVPSPLPPVEPTEKQKDMNKKKEKKKKEKEKKKELVSWKMVY